MIKTKANHKQIVLDVSCSKKKKQNTIYMNIIIITKCENGT